MGIHSLNLVVLFIFFPFHSFFFLSTFKDNIQYIKFGGWEYIYFYYYFFYNKKKERKKIVSLVKYSFRFSWVGWWFCVGG